MTSPSPQQLAIGDFLSKIANGSLIVEAVAGSGKTSTIVWIARVVIPLGSRSLFLAFNKRIAEELANRLPYWVTASTYHKCCLNALQRFLPKKPQIEDNKVKWLLKEEVPEWSERREIEPDLLRAIGFAKAAGTLALPNAPSFEEIADVRALDIDFALATRLLQKSNAKLDQIDFDDMLYLPLLLNVPLERVDNLFIDEAQDTNPVQLELTARMLNPNGRVIAVGDSRQAIYNFRGADANAMRAIKVRFNCIELPLSVSWRCARSIVAEARKYLLNPKPMQLRKGNWLFELED